MTGSAVAMARPYGEAGCGLGSIVMGNTGSQVLASTTNGSSYSNAFGITSGTSNCVEDGAVALNKELPLYIESNKESLATDVARGQGDSLATLSELVGCDQAVLAPALQKNYKVIFVDSQMQPAQIENSISHVAANSCNI